VPTRGRRERMFWTASEYAAAAGVSLRVAQYNLRVWHESPELTRVRVLVQRRGTRTRYLLDVASWRAATGIAADAVAA
jgi:hypothetical protein